MAFKKICFIIPSVASGGIEMYLLRYLNFIKDTRQITVLVRSTQRGELYNEYKATGAKLVFMPLGYLHLGKIWQHYQFYKCNDFDVICDFNANFSGIPMILARLLKIPKRIAFYRQGSDHFKPNYLKKKINKRMNRLVYNNATQILSNSQAALNFFFPYRNSSDLRFKVIYNGIDIKAYNLEESKECLRKDLGIPNDSFVIGHVGRLDKAKNHETILKVFKELQKEELDSFLVLCGRDTDKLLPLIDKLGIKEKTRILGYRQDVPRVLKSLNCFLFPSITEGQPNALIEAMISGIPVVASNIPSIKECVPESIHESLQNPLDVKGLKNEVIKSFKNTNENIVSEVSKKFSDVVNFELFKTILDG